MSGAELLIDAEASCGITKIRLIMIRNNLGFAEVSFPHVSVADVRLDDDKGTGVPLIIGPRRIDKVGREHGLWFLSPEAWRFSTKKLLQLWAEAQKDAGEFYPKKLVWVSP